jgi:hypothetical protein
LAAANNQILAVIKLIAAEVEGEPDGQEAPAAENPMRPRVILGSLTIKDTKRV